MRTSFCIYRLMNRQKMGNKHQILAIDARNGLLGVVLPEGGFHSPALFSLLTAAFRGRNQRFIKKCTLRWTITGYRPQCEVSSKVSQNIVKCTPESGHGKSPNLNSWTKKSPTPWSQKAKQRMKVKSSFMCRFTRLGFTSNPSYSRGYSRWHPDIPRPHGRLRPCR